MKKEEYLRLQVSGNDTDNVKIDTNMNKIEITKLLRRVIILIDKDRQSTLF